MPAKVNMKRLLPLAGVLLLYLAYVSAGVETFISGMWNNSIHSTSSYKAVSIAAIPNPRIGLDAKVVPDPAAVPPKNSYICDPRQQTPWIGCFIQ